MATILFQVAGAALGGVFGPVGAIAGRAIGALAGSIVDRSLIDGTQTVAGARLYDARIPGADEGTAINRVYGTARIGGTLIWATRFEEEATEERSGGKASGPRFESFRYFANFAVGICEGPIATVRRVWADGRELDLTAIEMRLHRGGPGQPPDPLIEAKQGAGRAPAYRGLAYAVFERLPLDLFGNRIPVLQFEVVRTIGKLEERIRAITLIPGSSEHGYDPVLVTERTGAGEGRNINRNTLVAATDWQASIDELQAVCPNLERVGLVVAWFGTELRAGHCRIVPGVEVSAREEESKPWLVSGMTRAAARLVSRTPNGSPAYGGTPSDDSVVAAIRNLKARGLEVYLYPFVLMDVPADNGLADPYGGENQAPYPWRGRITCSPATGQPGTADRTAAARNQVEAFRGGANPGHFSVSGTAVTGPADDAGYRRFMLHYALLAEAAGGVDGFIVGSEMRGLTHLRDAAGAFPFVEVLQELTQDVRAILGPATKLTYGADWSEYFGYQPADGSGEVHYNLDPLWSMPAIDAVGIDNYMPLSDWRDGDALAGNPDGFRLAEDEAGMRGMIAAGEGYDWYYATSEDRADRVRSPITDGLAGKPWVFRYKDLANWWSRRHFERTGGAEASEPTGWAPGSKPIWFTELGCPAVDKGANQPNVFTDPKSSEDALPYHSGGARSDAMQRRFLDAHHAWWRSGGAEPGMVDADRMFVWTWDARPYPAFPENRKLWADGGNWQLGHWVNGRLGAGTVAETIGAILTDHGFTDFDVSMVGGDLSGFVQAEQGSARSLLEPLMAVFQIDAVEEGSTLVFRSRMKAALPATVIEVTAEETDEPPFEETRGHQSEFSCEMVLDHFSDAAAYQRVSARSRRMAGGNDRASRLALPAVMHAAAAASAAESALRDERLGQRRLHFALPPNALQVTPGDVVALSDGPEGRFLVTRVSDGAVRRVEARGFAGSESGAPAGEPDQAAAPGLGEPSGAFLPEVAFLDLPVYGGRAAEDYAQVALDARPFRPVLVSSSPGSEGYVPRARLDRPARIGRLVATLGAGCSGRFDHANGVLVDVSFGAFSAADRIAVLGGANRVAVRADHGGWEVLGFLDAEEVAPRRWRLTGLLRGLFGTEDAMAAGHAVGATVVALDNAVVPLGLAADEAGRALNWIAEPAGLAGGRFGPVPFAGGIRAWTPLAPVHLRACRLPGGDLRLTWMRRGRLNADSWLAPDIPLEEPAEGYLVEILAGTAVVRSIDAAAATLDYGTAEEAADFGGPQPAISFRVRQKGQTVALGVAAQASVTL